MSQPVCIGLAIPLQGPGGIFAPSCEAVSMLIASQLNAHSGILGREVNIEVIDTGGSLHQTQRNVMTAITSGRIHALTGWHISSVREQLAPLLAAQGIPYVYTSLHEGARTPGVLSTGETPADQVIPGLLWLNREFGVHSWAIIGSKYIWPKTTARAVRQYARTKDIRIVHERFVDYGCQDFSQAILDLATSGAQGVIMLLVGRDAVLFNRQFAAAGLQNCMLRFTPLMEENMLLASGRNATTELYVAAAYFNSLTTQSALDFAGAYGAQFGLKAPVLNNAAESCYEGVLALAAVAEHAGSFNRESVLAAVCDGVPYEGPRGHVQLTTSGTQQQVHLARANEFDFDVLASLNQHS